MASTQEPGGLPVGLPVADTTLVFPRDTVEAGSASARVGRPTVPSSEPLPVVRYRSARDSLTAEATRVAAERARGLRVVVSLMDRQITVFEDADTLLIAPVAVGMDTTISYKGKSWRFETPRGRRTVLRKEENPVWVPPDWHYVEVATKKGLALAHLDAKKSVKLAEGRRLAVRNGLAGVITPDGVFEALPVDEEIVFGDTLYIPPFGSENRRIPNELGQYRLDLGNGYLLHGTPYEDSIGDAATHGCVRLFAEDIEWLYENIPVGTAVYIY